MPQCVINSGPDASNFVPEIVTVAFGTEVPNKSTNLLSLILKVNKEGTGATTTWSKVSHNSHTFLELPAAITN